MKILPLVLVVACVLCQATGRPQDEGEARAAPSRGLLKRGAAKGKFTSTTTTTTEEPAEEEYYEEEGDYEAEGKSSTTEAATTEGKKRVMGGVRPFRSNSDLLETLKRKRQQAAEAKLHGSNHASSAAASSQDFVTEAPAKSSYSKNKRVNSAPARDSNNEESPSASIAKPSRSRFGRPAARSIPDSEPEEQNEAAAPPARPSRAFARRGN